jgi:capsular exopolysaccharide synthesis family protein
MGRIHEAMSRASLDAGRDTGAESPDPAPSPWQIDQHDGAAAQPGDESPGGEPAPAAPPGHTSASEGGRPSRWAGFAPEALERLVASKTARPLFVEQFRILAAALLRAQAGQRLSSLLVTSASPGDGKSHVATNLALTFADSYKRRVLLIDADIRRPTLHQLFRVSNIRGLTDALNGKSAEPAAVVKISETLTLLPAGRTETNPLVTLSSRDMRRLIADAASRFDWIILDSPPVGVLADARLVSESVDAAVLVVRAGVTQFADVEAAADKLGRNRILGLVLNAAEPEEIRGGSYYGSYYDGGRSKN